MNAAETITETTAASFSFFSIFTQADFMIQFVMLLLIGASVWSWGVIFSKYSRFAQIQRSIKKFEKLFWSGESLDQIKRRAALKVDNPLSSVFLDGMEEWGKTGYKVSQNVFERVRAKMQAALYVEMGSLEERIPSLATIGSISPFVGLFGTVWGIVNSLQTIGAQKSTSLAIVAPPIAEALFATAIGLGVAIPAIVAYNKFARDLNNINMKGENFINEFIVVLSHQLDEAV